MDWKQDVKTGLDQWKNLSGNHVKSSSVNQSLYELRQDIDDQTTIMIMGEFNAGKSTFINALLGEKILSSDVTPETAMVTKLNYGEHKKIIAHYLNGDMKVFNDTWLEQLTAERSGKFQQVRRELSHVELQLPVTLLKKFTIIDTPGLNAGNEFHTKATSRFMERADYVFFLFHAMYVGNSTEIEWIKKLNEHGLIPIGIINRIDELEDDELDDLIEFNTPRLYPAVKKLIGVSAKEALKGRYQNSSQALEWSNWSEIEKLLHKCDDKGSQKLERTYTRMHGLIRDMEQIFLEEKFMLPLGKFEPESVSLFLTVEYPELITIKEQLRFHRSRAELNVREWNTFLDINSTSKETITQFLRHFMERSRAAGEQEIIAPSSNLLIDFENIFNGLYKVYEEKQTAFNLKAEKLKEIRESLDNDWKEIVLSNRFGKKQRIEKHEKKLEFYQEDQEILLDDYNNLSEKFKELKIEFDKIQQHLNEYIEKDINGYIEEERRIVNRFNQKLENIVQKFSQVLQSDVAAIKLFSEWLYSFKFQVIQPLLKAGENSEKTVPFQEASYLFEGIANLVSELPEEDFYEKWNSLNNESKETVKDYFTYIPSICPTEFQYHYLTDVPRELFHEVDRELDSVRHNKNKWLIRFAGAAALSLSIGGTVYSLNSTGSVEEELKEDVYADTIIQEEDSHRNAMEVGAEEENIEDEKKMLEDKFPREVIEDFLLSLYGQLDSDYYAKGRLFSENAWSSYGLFYENISGVEQISLNMEDVQYISGKEIHVSVKESYRLTGSIKEYETDYKLFPDPYFNEKLMVNGFYSKLINESETAVALNEGEIETFLTSFRDAYFQGLNSGNSDFINGFFEVPSPAYSEYQNYMNSIAGKGYSFEELGFQVSGIEEIGINEYRINSDEEFHFTDEKNEKTLYKRSKEYIVKASADNGLTIQKITIKDTQKERIIEPTVQLVTDNEVSEFITTYYSSFQSAFNGNGFSYVSTFYDTEGTGYASTKAYIEKANEKNMEMTNIELIVDSIVQADDNHYLASLSLIDEYNYQDGTGDQKKIKAEYLIKVGQGGNLMIAEEPTVEILEEAEL